MENNIKNNTDNYILNTYKRQDLVIDKGNDVYLYDINGRVYFGELTFSPTNGVFSHYTQEFLNEMGSKLVI